MTAPSAPDQVPSPGRARWRRLGRGVHWYLRELTGEADYDRYRARHEAVHPQRPAMTRREFERWRAEEKARTPGNRCC